MIYTLYSFVFNIKYVTSCDKFMAMLMQGDWDNLTNYFKIKYFLQSGLHHLIFAWKWNTPLPFSMTWAFIPYLKSGYVANSSHHFSEVSESHEKHKLRLRLGFSCTLSNIKHVNFRNQWNVKIVDLILMFTIHLIYLLWIIPLVLFGKWIVYGGFRKDRRQKCHA